MKKILYITISLLAICKLSFAKIGNYEYLNHLDVSLGIGTTGFDLDVSMPVWDIVKVRTGLTYMPKFKYKMRFGMQMGEGDQKIIDENGIPTSKFSRLSGLMKQIVGYDMQDNYIDVTAEPFMTQYKLLVDVTPFKNRNWQLTAGFYLGNRRIGKAYNRTYEMPTLVVVSMYNSIYKNIEENNPMISYRGITINCPDYIRQIILSNGKIGVDMGEFRQTGERYMMEPDNDCMVKANAFVNIFRPYIGFGYSGVTIPQVPKLKLIFDCGLIFWGGRPDIVMHDGVNLSKDVRNVRGQVGRYLDIINKFPVYPVLNIKLSYNIF